MWKIIEQLLGDALGDPFEISSRREIYGGSINDSFQLESRLGQRIFLKRNRAECRAMFEAEARGLAALGAIESGLRVPTPVACGVVESSSFLALTWLDLGAGGRGSWRELGAALARLHRTSVSPEGHGWSGTNWIGATPQPNPRMRDWGEFWRLHRIGHQFELASRGGRRFKDAERLLEAIPVLLEGHEPQACLCHGDLWSGNAAICADGTPTIFDPACYHGDREVDLAMSQLFGGFPAPFYQGYQEVWPLPRGHERRRDLYNLYHVLNHHNLFGGGYARQAEVMIQGLLATLPG